MSSTYDPNLVASPPGQPAWQLALLYSDQGQFSEEEYLGLGTSRLVEFDNGCIEVLPMPTYLHQLIVKFLFGKLDAFVTSRQLGTVLFAPLPIRLWTEKYREPDVVYVQGDRVRDIHGQPDGADLVMEVVSEGEANRRRDLDIKRRDYARAGIPEYWIVDPEMRRIIILALDGPDYRLHGEFGPGQTATSLLLQGFTVDVDAMLAVGQPPA